MSRISGLCVWLVGAGAALAACDAEKTDRPDYDGGCADTGCSGDGDSGSSPSGGRGGGGAEGEGGARGDVSGDVVVLADDFVATSTYTGTGVVRAQAPGARDWVEADIGQGAFLLDGVARSREVWFLARSSDAPLYFDTFTLQDTTRDELDVPLVPAALVEDIYGSAAQGQPRADSAQLVVAVRGQTGQGIPGVRVRATGAEFMAYAVGASWQFADTMQEPVTTEAGLAFAGNVPASKLPGQQLRITLSGAVSRDFYVRGAANAVTVVHVVQGP